MTIKEFEPKFYMQTELDKVLNDKKIDFKRTIENVISKDFGIAMEYLIDIEGYGMDLSQELNVSLYSDDFYNKLEDLKNEGKTIYIHSVYAMEDYAEESDTIYEYEIKDDDYVTVGISWGLGDCYLRVNKGCYTGYETSDYGILIKDDKIDFRNYHGGMFSGTQSLNFSEPLDQLAVEILLDLIVFKD